MKKRLYCYNGAVWNGDVIYNSVELYVHAYSPRQALELLKVRIKADHPMISYIQLKESNLYEVSDK